jgi:hypothetical protein
VLIFAFRDITGGYSNGGSDKCGAIPMGSLITAAARALGRAILLGGNLRRAPPSSIALLGEESTWAANGRAHLEEIHQPQHFDVTKFRTLQFR